MLSDLGSANGTRLNDQPVIQPVVLQRGDRLRLGDFEFIFDELESDQPETAQATSLNEPILLQTEPEPDRDCR